MALAGSAYNRRRSRHWIVIVLAAVVLHLMLFVSFKQSFFNVFRQSQDEGATASNRGGFPDAIIAIPISIEGEEKVPEQEADPNPVQPNEKPADPSAALNDRDMEDLIGQSSTPLPMKGTGSSAVIPPRPIVMSWPQIEKLGECLGLRIDLEIFVDESGTVQDVKPGKTPFPDDCMNAAVDAARSYRFRPGSIRGKTTAMWTRIRIDFRKSRR